jgi:hypothetical protein
MHHRESDAADAAWRKSTPNEVVEWLAALTVPWWIAGGWALDLFVGQVTRPHAGVNSLWCRRLGESQWGFELMLDECADGRWIFRRDPAIQRPLNIAIQRSPDGPAPGCELQLRDWTRATPGFRFFSDPPQNSSCIFYFTRTYRSGSDRPSQGRILDALDQLFDCAAAVGCSQVIGPEPILTTDRQQEQTTIRAATWEST